jgi:antitoxin VapB
MREMMQENQEKQVKIRAFMEDQSIDALILQRASSFAWATCGAASYINIASTTGEASLLITPSKKFLVTNNIEETRLKKEEHLEEQGWEFVTAPWYSTQDALTKLTNGFETGIDLPHSNYMDVSAPLARIRATLSNPERERFRALGRLCGQAMRAAAHRVQPGQTEYQLAGLLAEEAEKRGVQVTVNLVATDERIFNFRHPIPTDKKLDRYAILILCGRKWGLVCSITRFIHFGTIAMELQEKFEAVKIVDAALIDATRPGASLGDIFKVGIDAYNDVGFPDEWKLHHQGGPAGYEPREIIATPNSTERVALGQVFAWNPSITGTKSEDTILIGEQGNEILTQIEDWPGQLVEIKERSYFRPNILEM